MIFKRSLKTLNFAYWVILHVDFFQNKLFFKIFFQENQQRECQTVWIQVSFVLVQIVCECHQQTTLVRKELMDLKLITILSNYLYIAKTKFIDHFQTFHRKNDSQYFFRWYLFDFLNQDFVAGKKR